MTQEMDSKNYEAVCLMCLSSPHALPLTYLCSRRTWGEEQNECQAHDPILTSCIIHWIYCKSELGEKMTAEPWENGRDKRPIKRPFPRGRLWPIICPRLGAYRALSVFQSQQTETGYDLKFGRNNCERGFKNKNCVTSSKPSSKGKVSLHSYRRENKWKVITWGHFKWQDRLEVFFQNVAMVPKIQGQERGAKAFSSMT